MACDSYLTLVAVITTSMPLMRKLLSLTTEACRFVKFPPCSHWRIGLPSLMKTEMEGYVQVNQFLGHPVVC
jgi:hypothetical protein